MHCSLPSYLTRKLLLLSLIATPILGFSQIGPEHVISDPILEYPSAMHVVDLDGDGLDDIVAAGRSVTTWWRNTGNDQFTDMDTVAVNTHDVADIHSADLDGDGDNDLICAYNKYYCDADSLITQENRDSRIPPPPPPPRDGYLVWFENLGAGQFGPKNFIEDSVPIAMSTFTADLNGDSLVDVLLGVMEASIFECYPGPGFAAWYPNLGNGTFGERQLFSPLSDELSVSVIRSADMDGDGDMDVVATQNKDGLVVWYQNQGSGVFGTQLPLDSSLALNCTVMDVADMNNDNRPDLLLGEFSRVFWLQNDSADFSAGVQSTITTEVDYVKSVYPTDIDNDGWMDVVSASRWDSKVAWYPNLGQGIFGPQLVVDSTASGVAQVLSVRANSDNQLEILSLDNGGDNEISWYLNGGSWTFDRERVITPDLFRPVDFVKADLDNDLDDDILVVSYYGHKLSLFENLGNGSYSDPIILEKGFNNASKVRVADFDLDNDLDVVIYSASLRDLGWLENLGNGDFGQLQVIDANVRVTNLNMADMDNDGYPDVITSIYGNLFFNSTPDKVGWYRNAGNGTFEPIQELTDSIDYPVGIIAVDVDSDSDPDILVAGLDDDRIYWFENLGSGNFAPQQVFADSMDNVTIVRALDIDSDGDMDILSNGNSEVHWFENLGGGNFADLVIAETPISDVVAADVNLDLSQDLLLANNSGVYFENDGAFQFDSTQAFGQTYGVNYLLTSDADADGDEDVFALSANYHRLSWFENTTLNVGVEEFSVVEITLFPNPTAGAAAIRLNSPAKLSVYNTVGELILTKQCNGWASVHLEDHPNGIYLLNFETASGMVSKRLVKIK